MTKIVINPNYGGYGLSFEAMMLYGKKKGVEIHAFVRGKEIFARPEPYTRITYEPTQSEIDRDDPILVEVIEEIGNFAHYDNREMRIVEIPDGIEWQIENYDGAEWVAEKHRIWC